MRIALLSDIHGNRLALEAVLADARAAGADVYWVLGDLVAFGPEPVSILEQLTALADLSIVRGNTDRYVVTGELPPPASEDAPGDPRLSGRLARIAASFAWTRGYVTACGWFDWLADLPTETRLSLPDGSRLLGVHASPGCDDGEGIHPARANAEIAALIEGCEADLICVGHTHQPMLREVGEVRVVNLGSVSNPLPPDLRASYVLIEGSASGARIQHRRVAYDRDAFIESVRRSHHPVEDFIVSFQLGARRARAPHADHPEDARLL